MKYGIHLLKLPTATTRTDGMMVYEDLVHFLDDEMEGSAVEYYEPFESGEIPLIYNGTLEMDCKSHSAWRDPRFKGSYVRDDKFTKQYRSRLSKRKGIRSR